MDIGELEKIDKKLFKLNNNIKKIFEYVKYYKWIKLKNTIKELCSKNKDVDLNIKDDNNIYFLEYLILFNKYDILEIIIKNIKIDIIDENYRTILYNIVKYSYVECLDIILSENENNIGINILEMYDDDGNNGLFYSIKFNNLIIFSKIINKTKNIYSKNNSGLNSLHFCVKYGNYNIFKILLKYFKNINVKTNDGETCFHIAITYNKIDIISLLLINNIDFNIAENKYNQTPLHYIAFDYKINICELILPYVDNINGNIQDKCGNIFMHYFLNNIDSNIDTVTINKIYDIFILIKFDYNIYNIDGDCCLHILLKNLKKYDKKYIKIINNFINNTNLNIQNNDGESCLFLLIKYKYWYNIKNILKTKKLDIFQFNNNRKTIFDYVDDFDDFINLVSESYLYQIKNIDNIVFHNYWDNICKKDININNIKNNLDIDKFNININSKELCFEIIYKKLLYNINFFLEKKKLINEIYSYPKIIIYPKLIDTYEDIIVSTFSTSTIDEFFGLLYLCKTHNNVKSSLNLLDFSSNIVECNNCCEFLNYEFTWSNFKLYDSFEFLQNLLISIKNDNKIRFFIVPLGIKIYNNDELKGHANYLIFDFFLMEVERFEPYGSTTPQTMNYNSNSLDYHMEMKIASFTIKFKYISPQDYLPKISLQLLEISETKSDYIGDADGFCALWCIFWVDIRLKYPNIPRKKLIFLLKKEIVNSDYSYKKLIRNYGKKITDSRDILLNKINLNINEWYNDNISEEKLLKLNNLVKEEIKTVI